MEPFKLAKDTHQPFAKILILAGILYPSWGILIWLFKPESFDDIPARIVVGAISILIGINYRKLGPKMVFATHLQATLFMVHFSSLIARSGAEERYLFGGLIFSLACFFVFMNHPRAYLIHIGIVFFSLMGMTVYYDVFTQTLPFTRQVGLIYLIMYSFARIFRSHTSLIETLQTERIELLEERGSLLINNLKSAQSVFSSLSSTREDVPPSLDLKFYYKPATEAGGDWLSHHYSKEKNWFIAAIGDVTGHDLSSSLVTIAVAGASRGAYEGLLPVCKDLRDLISKIASISNTAVCHSGVPGKCMSAAFIGLDMNLRKGYYVNCAHPAVLIKASGKTKQIRAKTTPFLGQMTEPPLPIEFDLDQLKSLLLYTDGLVENSKKTLTEGRFVHMVDHSKNLYDDLCNFAQELADDEDDVTFMVIEFKESMTVDRAPRSSIRKSHDRPVDLHPEGPIL